MLATVTCLRPRLGSLTAALTAYRAAALRTCLSELGSVASFEATLLRARALLRLARPEAAAESLAGADAVTFHDRAELALLRAVIYSRIGQSEDAEADFRDARVYAISSTDLGLEAEVEFYRALSAFGEGALDEARASCKRGLETIASLGNAAAPEWSIPVAHVRSRLQELVGLIEAARGRYTIQLEYARAALATLDGCSIRDVYQEAFALANLAILVRDFDLAADNETVARRLGVFPWTEDIARVKFRTLEAMSWSSALRGDTVGALRWLRSAAGAVSTLPEEINVAVDRAVLARELGHGALATEELEHAVTLSRECDWNAAADDQREVLLYLAQAVGSSSAERGREALERYGKISTAMSSVVASRLEARVRAEEAYAHGVVLRAEGRVSASIERLDAAFKTWDAIGYEWRAARAALELAELEAGDVFRRAVHRELRLRPESVFATRARVVA